MKRPPHIWVVEMFNFYTQHFEPTTGCGITRQDARRELKDYWQYNHPSDDFRVRKYERAQP